MNNNQIKSSTKNIVWLIVLAIFFLIDRYLKYLALSYLNKPFILIEKLLSFNFIPNYQIAFSLPFSGLWLNIIIILIIAAINCYLILNQKKLNSVELISLSAIIIGAISNLIDRLTYGFVIDYLDLSWFTIFNLADVMISIGTLIIFIYLIKLPKKNSR